MVHYMCDLCGCRIEEDVDGRKYKLKVQKGSLFDGWMWVNLDCHDECVRKLYEAAKKQKEEVL